MKPSSDIEHWYCSFPTTYIIGRGARFGRSGCLDDADDDAVRGAFEVLWFGACMAALTAAAGLLPGPCSACSAR
jgi:hypothetical protein